VDHQRESSNKGADHTISKSAACQKTKGMQARGAVNRMQRAAQLRLEQEVASSSDSPLFVPILVTAPFC